MDVLADRKTAGRHTGRVTVNGFEKNADSFARVMGYGEQIDTHSSGATVEEAVRTSAFLRLSRDIPEEQACFVPHFFRHIMCPGNCKQVCNRNWCASEH
jgi:ABC-type multidrug transport system ATPase subunit